jgi:hypothetical protein
MSSGAAQCATLTQSGIVAIAHCAMGITDQFFTRCGEYPCADERAGILAPAYHFIENRNASRKRWP